VKKQLLIWTFILFNVLSLGVLTYGPTARAASPFGQVCSQLTEKEQAQSPVCADANKKTNPITGRDGLLRKVVDIFSWVIGVASIIMVIFGGIKYAISAGDATKVKAARETITYAVIGLIIAVTARGIIIFVLNG